MNESLSPPRGRRGIFMRTLGVGGLSCIGIAAIVFATIAVPGVRAQGVGDAELQPDEVRVSLFFGLATTYDPATSERETTHGKGLISVSGNFAARLSAPAPGRRTLTNFRRLPDSLNGRLADEYHHDRTHEYGEGGWHVWRTSQDESWQAGNLPVSQPGFFLDIDLDASTWTMADFEDEPSRWFTELKRQESFWGNYVEPDDNGQAVWRVSADPSTSLVRINAWITQTGLDLITAPSPYSLRVLTTAPQPLQRQPNSFGGSLERNSPDVAGFVAAWGMNWAVYNALPELELRVTAPEFETWRPRAGADLDAHGKNPGPPLVLTAQVLRPTGGSLESVRIRKMRWSLNDTSRLPGVAMNFPYGSQDTSPDLEIGNVRATDEKQNLIFENLTTLKSTISVLPYDWGGWSTLRVEAELDDGRKLQGIYKGPYGDQTDILLPARDPETKIARSWRKLMKATEADDADEDQVPPGKASALGDGFSLFEEYRGFYVSASVEGNRANRSHRGHVSLHPLRHHVFVYDLRNDSNTQEGLRLFAEASGLTVYVIHPGDGFLNSSRVMNPNRGAGPTKGDQHAIGIQPGIGGLWRPTGGNGRPARSEIQLSSPITFANYTPQLLNRPDLYRRAIAQELLKACGVPLPGTGDKQLTLRIERLPGGGSKIVAEGETVTLRDEAGRDLAEDWLADIDRFVEGVRLRLRSLPDAPSVIQAVRDQLAIRRYYVARTGGEHSGPLGNIMRYTIADGYRLGNTSTIILLPKGFHETVGLSLSTTSAGDGYNTPNVPPARYGSSTAPPSADTVVVNDHAP